MSRKSPQGLEQHTKVAARVSCATHAFEQMPLVVTVFDPAGNVVNERIRS